MIPRKIHFCWFGPSPKSDLNRRCMESWRRALPGYEIKEWNETNSPLDGDYARAALAERRWSKLSNLVRLHALYAEGGIYFDTDVEVLKDFSPLLRHDCFLGFQIEEESVDWIGAGVIGARAGHPFVKRCMVLTQGLFASGGGFYVLPTVLTRVLREMGMNRYGLQEAGGVTLYPADYFYPYSWLETYSPYCVTENTYSVHHWEHTWTAKPAGEARPLRKRLMNLVSRGLARNGL